MPLCIEVWESSALRCDTFAVVGRGGVMACSVLELRREPYV